MLGAGGPDVPVPPVQQLPVLSPQTKGGVWLLGLMPSLRRNW